MSGAGRADVRLIDAPPGGSVATTGWRVPGRIEVLGKHTDYCGGRVLVCSVSRAVTVRARLTGGGASGTVTAKTDAFPDAVTITAGSEPSLPPGHWGRYVHTAVERMTSNFGPLAAAELSFTTDLPPASGMSSSSALLTGVVLALADINGLWERPEWTNAIADRLDLAGYAASVENGKSFGSLQGRPGVGTSGGSLDHTGILTSEEGMLSLVEFDPPELLGRVPAPAGYTFVIGVSGVLAEKTGAARDAYNRGPRVLGEILARWNAGEGRADTSLNAVARHLGGDNLSFAHPVEAADAALRADSRFAPLARYAKEGYESRRLHQFLAESSLLVPAAASALREGDMAGFAAIVEASNSLAVTHLENQVPETIDLVKIARDQGAVAASPFGAGFGGSVWALVPDVSAQSFAQEWLSEYRSRYDYPLASTILGSAGPAAERIA